jgi:hypothetical protein
VLRTPNDLTSLVPAVEATITYSSITGPFELNLLDNSVAYTRTYYIYMKTSSTSTNIGSIKELETS